VQVLYKQKYINAEPLHLLVLGVNLLKILLVNSIIHQEVIGIIFLKCVKILNWLPEGGKMEFDKIETHKLLAGKYLKPVQFCYKGNRIYLKFGFNKALLEEVRNMKGRKWHGFDDEKPMKLWSIPICSRNDFVLQYLMNKNPYARYDASLVDYETQRPLREYQLEMVRSVITRRMSILACEMGTGKSLVAIEAAEWAMKTWPMRNDQIWYVGPKAGVRAVERELVKWEAKINPNMYTYNKLVSILKSWKDSIAAPRVFIIDESSKVKTPTSQRSQACFHVAESMRKEYGDDCLIIEMSGTPAPRSPDDWWNQAEIARPGFLAEGNINILKKRLSLIEERENPITGGVYPHLVTWLDDESKCAVCGRYRDDPCHNQIDFQIVLSQV
jgi:hypothetical protein